MSKTLSLYLSQLVVNVGDKSDAACLGHNWIRQPYLVYQRLCMAFPVANLDPIIPAEAQPGFLFRIEHDHPQGTVILVQSTTRPQWDIAFHNAEFLLRASPESPGWLTHSWEPVIEKDSRWHFRLVARPTAKSWFGTMMPNGTKKMIRLSLAGDSALRKWLLGEKKGSAKKSCEKKGSGLFLWSSSWASCGFEPKSNGTSSGPVVITKRQAAFDTAAK